VSPRRREAIYSVRNPARACGLGFSSSRPPHRSPKSEWETADRRSAPGMGAVDGMKRYIAEAWGGHRRIGSQQDAQASGFPTRNGVASALRSDHFQETT
jgi:hypothetical protein